VTGRPVLKIIPNSLLPEVIHGGRPIPVDLMQFEERWLVVMRTPIRDARERVTSAVGFALYDQLDYLKPLVSKLTRLETSLAEARQLLATGRVARHSLAHIVGTSEAITRIKRHARRAAQNDSTVLLLGEAGTGKELLAHAIHNASRRVNKLFLPKTRSR
jgi:transcriptional regulator with PAS, ATPase and Fis domain